MNIGEPIDRNILVKKFESFSDLRSSMIFECGPRIGGLAHGRFIRTHKNNDELWKFSDKNNKNPHSRDGFAIIRLGVIIDLEYV